MIINHNISALNTHRQLGANNNAVQNSLEKLSSGLQINKAADDAAGLAISEKMRGQIRGLEQAQNNAQDGISLIQTAEGALSETQDILQRMRELAVQSSNDTNTNEDRGELQQELNQLANALNDISSDTEFNTKKLLDGSVTEGFTFHVGANSNQNLSVSINKMDADTLGVSGTTAQTGLSKATDETIDGIDGQTVLKNGDDDVVAVEVGGKYYSVEDVESDGENTPNLQLKNDDAAELTVTSEDNVYTIESESAGINISNQTDADSAIETIQSAIDEVSAERSKLGAVQNRLDHTINNLGASAENLTAAESRIRDVDYTEVA